VNTLSSTSAPPIALGDANGDGRTDLFAIDGNRLIVARQLPAGDLDPHSGPVFQSFANTRIAAADFDGDGRDDAWIPGVGLLLAGTEGEFATAPVLAYGPATDWNPGSDVQPVDVNDDGLPDLVSASGEAWEQGDVSGPRILLARPADL
jgi:hypothetical protein